MRHGVLILPERRWTAARAAWTRAEELGYEHAWTFDHLMWRSLADKPWFSALPTLTAAAAVTSRIRIGALVANPNNRHPVDFAKELMALDDISGGRAVCAVGSGADGFDARIRGERPLGRRERTARFAEFVELTDLLLRQSLTSYRGAWYAADGVRLEPGFLQTPRIPLAVAGAGPKGMALAARYADIWVTTGAPEHSSGERYDRSMPALRTYMARLDEACAAAGRDPGSLRRLLFTGTRACGVLDSVEAYRDAAGLGEQAGITDLVVPWPRREPPFEGNEDVLEEFAAATLTQNP
jgi:alkanesulfonate monooxygenase SsuD/methylene tetrahydromethanopterin reductase-like flavin-dependent oxidoreductase (luciferase family)